VRYAWIDAHRPEFALADRCAVLEVSASSDRAWQRGGTPDRQRRMREHNIQARHKQRDKVTTDAKHSLPVAENLLARNVQTSAPNPAWASDITYLWTAEGWL